MVAPSPPSGGPAPGSVENANLVSLLGTTRTLTRIWMLVGLVVGLLSIISIVLSIIALHFYGGGVGGLVYAIIWVVVDLMLLDRIGGYHAHLSAGQYQSLKEPLLLWGILALVFGVLPGILLLLIYARVLPWPDYVPPAGSPTPPTVSIPAGAANPPAASAPAAEPPKA